MQPLKYNYCDFSQKDQHVTNDVISGQKDKHATNGVI